MKVVISGSFRKSLTEIIELKEQLESKGIEVLNPKSKTTIDNNDNPEFVLFAGEKNEDANELERKYLESISSSDAHIVYVTSGYLGETAFSEMLFACSLGIPVYLTEQIETLYCSGKPQSIGLLKAIEMLVTNGSVKIGVSNLLSNYNFGGRQLKLKKDDDVTYFS